MKLNLRIAAALTTSTLLLVSCGNTTQTQETQSPALARAQSVSAGFAQTFVTGAKTVYGLTDVYGLFTNGLITRLTNGSITPSLARDEVLNRALVGGSSAFQTTNSDYYNPQNFVRSLYRQLLGRDADADGAFWTNALASGQLTPAQVRDRFLDSAEFASRKSNRDFGASLYSSVLRRAASQVELDGAENALRSYPRSSVARWFLDSGEFANCQFINFPYYFEQVLIPKLGGWVYPGPLAPALRCS
jgi:Domain of unknown function (DUF4214)